MSARYEQRPVGVHDNETDEDITPWSGEAWAKYHEWLAVPGNVADPMPPPPAISFAEALAEKLSQIEQHAIAQRRRVTEFASSEEMASWTVKANEARAFLASPVDAAAPNLAAEAAARGLTTAVVVARVARNSNDFLRAEAAIAGNAGRHRDAVRLLNDAAAVLAYDFSDGWPFMPPPSSTPMPASSRLQMAAKNG